MAYPAFNDPKVKQAFRWLFRKAGRAGRGKCKARTPEQAKAATAARERKREEARAAEARRKAGDKLEIARYGGSRGKGAVKARTSEQARHAVACRIAKRKARLEAEARAKTAAMIEQIKAKDREREKQFRETWFTK